MNQAWRIAAWTLLLGGCGRSLREGADAFQSGDPDRAAAVWSAAAAEGGASSAIWYNLGISWYQRGDLPRAVHAWRTAEALAPRDAATQHNLALARTGLPGTPPPVGVLPGWAGFLTPGELGAMAVLTVSMASGAAFARWRAQQPVTWRIWSSWALGLVVGLICLSGFFVRASHPLAVVLDEEIRARPSADAAAPELFRLAPGSEVTVEGAVGEWRVVRDGRDRRGYVPRDHLGVIGELTGLLSPERAPASPTVR